MWLEHRTQPKRLSPFFTRQEILPELVLCVDIGPFDPEADVRIKDAKTSHIFYSAVSGVQLSEVGLVAPKSFVLCTRDGSSEVTVQVAEEPNQTPQPTTGLAPGRG